MEYNTPDVAEENLPQRTALMSEAPTTRPSFSARIFSLLRSNRPLENRLAAAAAVLLLAVWLAAVVFTESRHEFWRDEVRALSLVQTANSPFDLFRIIQYDGHPVLWYLILYAGNAILHTNAVLPIAAVGIGFAAAALFLFVAPMPFWFKGLFLFSAIPFYEFSVMARNYGISMLLLFIIAGLYPHREKLGAVLALAIALLANTNVHSIVFAGLITAVWTWDTIAGKRTALSARGWVVRGFYVLIILAGMIVGATAAFPRENTILTPIRQTLNLPDLVQAAVDSALHPEATFDRVLPVLLPRAIVAALFFLAMFGLLFRPQLFLAAFFGAVAFGVIFRLVYFGFLRHQGLYIVFLVFLYWVYRRWLRDSNVTGIKRWLCNAGFYVSLPLIIAGGVGNLRDSAWRDIRMEVSSSRALGEWLNASAEYRDAVLIPEPDYLIEAVAYYAPNPIYMPREHAYTKTVSWTTAPDVRLSLAELLEAARRIHATTGKPVLIVLGHLDLDFSKPGELNFSYNKYFSWDESSWTDFQKSTRLVAEFRKAIEDENYLVYALTDALPSAGVSESVSASWKMTARALALRFLIRPSGCPI
jgi:hypothetical protein